MDGQYEILKTHLTGFAGLTDKDFNDTRQHWRTRRIKKGNFFNMQNVVCDDLGFVIKGIFRIYYNDPVTSEEKNIFFISENHFIVSIRSFITRYPWVYYIEALEDAEIVYIGYRDLNNLYDTYAGCSKFGRMLAELLFNHSQGRTEELLFNSHEERYIKLLEEHPNIVRRIPAYHISSYLGITNPSLSRIRKRIQK